jgi:hypothetical protein
MLLCTQMFLLYPLVRLILSKVGVRHIPSFSYLSPWTLPVRSLFPEVMSHIVVGPLIDSDAMYETQLYFS